MGDFSTFMTTMNWAGLRDFLLTIFGVLVCLTVHEASHGFAAYLLGDPTAKQNRRLSLNPLRHIDPFGALMMIAVGFGWAKPVPVDMRYFKRPKLGMAITALAGPVSNFLLAYLLLLARSAIFPLYHRDGGTFLAVSIDTLASIAVLSVGLGLFNLIPFPPLDGSKVLEGVLPDALYYKILRYEHFGMFLLMAVLWSGILDGPLYAARSFVLDAMLNGTLWAFDLVVQML